jgi:L-seryl-tRNA(Ser) seleniumtransferase
MEADNRKQEQLRRLPGVDRLLTETGRSPDFSAYSKPVLLKAIRTVLDSRREAILASTDTDAPPPQPVLDDLVAEIAHEAAKIQAFNLTPVVNATGVVVHTNLGRSCLAPEAMANINAVANHYSNLEFDLARGRRGSRYSAVEDVICEISGAEAAMVVNNNAGAVLLSLDTLARDRSVVLSRGEMVEIGGSFRIPDVMAKSGARLVEIGTTNRTHLADYERAISSETGLLLKVHTSNYAIVGFTKSVSLAELVALGRKFDLPVMEDLGSGNFVDFRRYGLYSEPTVQESVATGADVITFSGDKLLGGPQAGLIVGKKPIIDAIKSNPLTRALRIDKMTLAALEATLSLYRDPEAAASRIPTLSMITAGRPEIEARARQLESKLKALANARLTLSLLDRPSRAGGGSLPLLEIPSCCIGVSIDGMSTNAVEAALRSSQPPVIGRIEDDFFILDPRTLTEGDDDIIVTAFSRLLE